MIKIGDIYSKNGFQYIVIGKHGSKSIALHRLQFNQFSNYDFMEREDKLLKDYEIELHPHLFHKAYSDHINRSFKALIQGKVEKVEKVEDESP